MKYNANIMNYIGSWARMNNLFVRTNNIYDESSPTILSTDIVVKKSEHSCVSLGRFTLVWSEMCEEPMRYAESIINNVKKTLAGYSDTDEPDSLYPKLFLHEFDMNQVIKHHEEFKKAFRHISNSVYGATNFGRTHGKSLYQSEYWAAVREAKLYAKKLPSIEDVIFNDPATIVFWKDGTKTVVKAQDEEEYDPEKGLAMGNNRDYYLTFKKYLKKYDKQYPELPQTTFEEALKRGDMDKTSFAFPVSNWDKLEYNGENDKSILECRTCGYRMIYDGDYHGDCHFPCSNCNRLESDVK